MKEIPGAAAAEGVDGLLGIAHEEHLLPAHETEELLLHEVDILILIHEHIAVAAAHRLAHLLVAQHAEGALLEVVVVEETRLALETAEAFSIVEDERGKRTGARGCLFMTDALCLRVDAAQRLYDLLEGGRDRAQAEDARELFPRRLGLGRSGRDLSHPLCETDGLPEALLGEEGPHLLREHGAQPFARSVPLKGGGELFKLGIERGDLSAVSLQDRRSDPLEGNVARLGKALFGIAHRTHLRIHRTDGAAQEKIALLAVIIGKEQLELLAALPIGLVERLVEGAGGDRFALRVVGPHDAEGGIDVIQIEIGADEARAKDVHRADVGQGQGGELFLEAGTLGGIAALPHRLDEGGAQLFAHLCRGLVGVGDGEHIAHVHPADDEGDETADHDEGLAAARRSGHDDLPPRPDGGLLFGSQFQAHFSPFARRTMETISPQLILFSLRSSLRKPQSAPNLQYLQAPS